MKTPLYGILIVAMTMIGLPVLVSALHAENLTVLAGVMANGADPTLMHTALLTALGLAFAPIYQNVLEHFVMERPFINAYLKRAKSILPPLLSGAAAWLATKFNVPVSDVLTVWAAITGGASFYNATSFAADANAVKPKPDYQGAVAGAEVKQ